MAARKKTTEETEPETQNVVIPLPKTLHRQLRFLSVDRGQPMNALIVEAVRSWWERQPEFSKYAPEGEERKGRSKKG
jgi:hypothetical protein